jgi:hypothetical protein
MSRSESDQRKAIQHLQYEIDMFVFTADAISAGRERLTQAEINALLESFTIHARALIGVFFPYNPYPEDVLAQHFVPEGSSWAAIAGELPESLAKVRKRVGTEIVHLSYGRNQITDEAKQWDITAIKAAMLALIDKFWSNTHYRPTVLPTVEIIPDEWPKKVTSESANPTRVNSVAIPTVTFSAESPKNTEG